MPGVRASGGPDADGFGAGIGRTLQQAGNQATAIILEAQRKADETAIDEATNALYQLEATRVYDAQTGVLSTRGKDALPAAQSVYEEYDKLVSDLSGNLNERQREAFHQRADRFRLGLFKRVENHVHGEIGRHMQATQQARIENAHQAAVANYDDPDRIRLELARETEAVLKMAEGQDPEVIKATIAEVHSRTHMGVIDRMLQNQQGELARAYYNQNREAIRGDQLGRVEAVIADAETAEQEQRYTEDILAYGQSEEESINLARSVVAGKMQDRVVQRLRHRFAEQKQFEQQQREQAFNDQWAALEQNPATANERDIPRNIWVSLSPQQQQALKRHAEQLRKGIQPSLEDDDTWALYDGLRQQAINPEQRPAFVMRDLTPLRSQLPEREFREIYELQQQLKSEATQSAAPGPADTRANKLLNGIRTSTQIANDSLQTAGVDPQAKPGTEDHTTALKFRRSLDQAIVQHQMTTGKEASGTEIQALADSLLMRIAGNESPAFGWWNLFAFTPPGGLYSSYRAAAWAKGEKGAYLMDLAIDDVPEDFQKRSRAALRNRGLAVTDEMVVFAYREKLARENQ